MLKTQQWCNTVHTVCKCMVVSPVGVKVVFWLLWGLVWLPSILLIKDTRLGSCEGAHCTLQFNMNKTD